MFEEGHVIEENAVPMAGFVPAAGRGVRTELCDRVRAQIASGEYDTGAKLDAALVGLSADLVAMSADEDDDIAGFDHDLDDEDEPDLRDEDDDEDVFGDAGGGGADALAESELVRPAWMNRN